ncbi:hypothetical protein KO507_12320 [Gilvimarinus agarilyticus]|uniref:hypothetical protein n=1 Tax=Gilvimarinus sp. 2_MG-2023 TaxID=3062666 RepID=UPI001C09DB9D|nr:hypothetical protein [Gilvimarinus sp. 2_MG-2023]MBU2886549.1 hypothetical protein [Gilvimarinus agarilyticus]MDO6571217.1 hypothetical protein [Gilvimarinus sp. 2_MG-2023]
MNHIIWQGRCSVLVYLYPYFFIALCTLALFPIHPLLSAAGFAIMVGFMMDAYTTRYTLTDEEMVVAGGLLGAEPTALALKDITNIYIIDDVPWHVFSLGWVLLVLNEEDDIHPCIRCVRKPLKVGALIESAAIKAGAKIKNHEEEQPPSS